MGELISVYFDLDPSNPDEERALQILEEWQNLGLSVQHIMTLALITLDEDQAKRDHLPDPSSLEAVRQVVAEINTTTRTSLEEIKHTLGTMQAALKNLENLPAATAAPDQAESPSAPAPAVSPELLNSLKKSLHRGMTLGDS